MKYTNPVIRGYFPDPSVCSANGSYYLICSSFHYYPSIPLFKSDNLVDWELIGHCLTRKSQLDLTGAAPSAGLFAPTIRYHNGRFYVIVTNTSTDTNFYVYTDDINGEWSDPIAVRKGGIDPSLFFDGDKAYYMSNGADDSGDYGIVLAELDIETGSLLSPVRCISHGTGGRFPEAPHLYHIGDYYYLMLAEGGTEYGHMENILRSRTLFGEYEPCPTNPILTNRNLGGYTIQGAGHGDLVADERGEWWMVFLAFRQITEWRQFHHLGREVCLLPVRFDADGWPTVGTDGTCREAYEIAENGEITVSKGEYPEGRWMPDSSACYLRRPDLSLYSVDGARLRLRGIDKTLNDWCANTSFYGIRQNEFNYTMKVRFDGSDLHLGQIAGITAYMTENYHYDIKIEKGERYKTSLELTIDGIKITMNSLELSEDCFSLTISADSQQYSFYVTQSSGEAVYLGSASTKLLSSEVAETFTGVLLGAFCVAASNGESGWAEFSAR